MFIYRYKSPLRPHKESTENIGSQSSKARRVYSPDGGRGPNDMRKHSNRELDREKELKKTDRRRDKLDKKASKREKQRQEDPVCEAPNLKISDNPVFEARRRKFENTAVVEPASKKIRLVNRKNSPIEQKVVEETQPVEGVTNKETIESNDQHDDKSISNEIDEIDNFLNEDVLDLSAAVWSSDDEFMPKINNAKKGKVTHKVRPIAKMATVKAPACRKETG